MDRREAAFRGAESALWRSLGVRPEERRIRLAGLGIDVRVQELGTGRPVLFVHGASTCGSSWAGLVARLKGRRCLVLDRPGTGLSDRLPRRVRTPADMRRLADTLLIELLDGLGIDHVDVVATSLGGLFAFRAALAQPERIRRIVEFGWTPAAGLDRLPRILRLGSVPILGEVAAGLQASDGSVLRMFRAVGLRGAVDAGKVSREAIDAYAALLNHTQTLRNEIQLGRSLVSPIHGLRPGIALGEDDLRRVVARTLVVWGVDDVFGSPDLGGRFVGGLPSATIEVVADAGHAVWVDDPDMAATRTAAFLAG
jgi:pimeloyl-ACP methyl ester carboxylesterase